MSKLRKALELEQYLIQRRRGATKRDLAEALGISVRTVDRYLKDLRDAGLPITATGTERDGEARLWRIDREGFHGLPSEVPALNMTFEEAFVVAASLESATLPRSKWLDDARESTLEKLAVYLSARESRRLPVLRAGVVHTGPDESRLDDIPEQVVGAWFDGATRKRRIEVTYPWRGKRPTARTVEPLGVLMAHGGLYGVGRVRPFEDVRQLSLTRVVRVRVLEEEFDPPKDFSLSDYAASGFSLWKEDTQKIVIRFSPDAADAVRARRVHPTQRLRSRADGGVTMTLHTSGQWEIIWWILQWGENAELIEPKEWREEIRKVAKNVAGMYE